MATAHPRDRRMTWRDQACLLEELGMLGWDALRHAGDAGLAAHRHRGAFEICLIVRGGVEWWVRRGSRTEIHVVEPGCVYLTRPGEVHGGVDAVLHACELYWLHLRSGEGELPGMSRGQARSLFQRLRGLPRTFRAAPAVQRGMEALVAEHVDPDAWSAVRARAALHELLVALLRSPTTAELAGGVPSAAVQRAMRWMESNLADDYAIDDAAGVAGLSIAQFHERFHREVGYTPGDWRLRQRITFAKRLLRERHTAILDIALAAGFTSSQYFATAFRRITGLTPRDYRRRLAHDSDAPGRRAVSGS